MLLQVKGNAGSTGCGGGGGGDAGNGGGNGSCGCCCGGGIAAVVTVGDSMAEAVVMMMWTVMMVASGIQDMRLEGTLVGLLERERTGNPPSLGIRPGFTPCYGFHGARPPAGKQSFALLGSEISPVGCDFD